MIRASLLRKYQKFRLERTKNDASTDMDSLPLRLLCESLLSDADRAVMEDLMMDDIMERIFDDDETATVSRLIATLEDFSIPFSPNCYLYDGSTPLHVVSSKGYSDCVRMIIQQGAYVNAVHRKLGHTALHYAAMVGSVRCMNHLINAGAERAYVNKMSGKMRTALHYAAENGSTLCLLMLLSPTQGNVVRSNEEQQQLQGIIDLQDMYGNTALHLACIEGSEECVKMLLEHGSSVFIKNNQGQSVVDVARMMNRGSSSDTGSGGHTTSAINPVLFTVLMAAGLDPLTSSADAGIAALGEDQQSVSVGGGVGGGVSGQLLPVLDDMGDDAMADRDPLAENKSLQLQQFQPHHQGLSSVKWGGGGTGSGSGGGSANTSARSSNVALNQLDTDAQTQTQQQLSNPKVEDVPLLWVIVKEDGYLVTSSRWQNRNHQLQQRSADDHNNNNNNNDNKSGAAAISSTTTGTSGINSSTRAAIRRKVKKISKRLRFVRRSITGSSSQGGFVMDDDDDDDFEEGGRDPKSRTGKIDRNNLYLHEQQQLGKPPAGRGLGRIGMGASGLKFTQQYQQQQAEQMSKQRVEVFRSRREAEERVLYRYIYPMLKQQQQEEHGGGGGGGGGGGSSSGNGASQPYPSSGMGVLSASPFPSSRETSQVRQWGHKIPQQQQQNVPELGLSPVSNGNHSNSSNIRHSNSNGISGNINGMVTPPQQQQQQQQQQYHTAALDNLKLHAFLAHIPHYFPLEERLSPGEEEEGFLGAPPPTPRGGGGFRGVQQQQTSGWRGGGSGMNRVRHRDRVTWAGAPVMIHGDDSESGTNSTAAAAAAVAFHTVTAADEEEDPMWANYKRSENLRRLQQTKPRATTVTTTTTTTTPAISGISACSSSSSSSIGGGSSDSKGSSSSEKQDVNTAAYISSQIAAMQMEVFEKQCILEALQQQQQQQQQQHLPQNLAQAPQLDNPAVSRPQPPLQEGGEKARFALIQERDDNNGAETEAGLVQRDRSTNVRQTQQENTSHRDHATVEDIGNTGSVNDGDDDDDDDDDDGDGDGDGDGTVSSSGGDGGEDDGVD